MGRGADDRKKKTVTEEYVTTKAAYELANDGWEVVSVNPPDGQGPFSVPRPASVRDIERASFNPDIVCIKKDKNPLCFKILIGESKLDPDDVLSDIEKIRILARTPESLYFVGFRLQKTMYVDGVDLDKWNKTPYKELPIIFCFAYRYGKGKKMVPKNIEGFPTLELPIDI